MTALLKRRRAERHGRFAELGAMLYLCAKGYLPLARRLKTKQGELDLVARKGRTIIFVEVKLRPTAEQALHAITASQQQRLHKAATWWLAKQRKYATYEIRFDVVALSPWRWPLHLKNVMIQG